MLHEKWSRQSDHGDLGQVCANGPGTKNVTASYFDFYCFSNTNLLFVCSLIYSRNVYFLIKKIMLTPGHQDYRTCH